MNISRADNTWFDIAALFHLIISFPHIIVHIQLPAATKALSYSTAAGRNRLWNRLWYRPEVHRRRLEFDGTESGLS